MAFVNELIPEQRKNEFPFPVSTRPDGSKPTLWKWVTDHERDAFLVLTKVEGGPYEGTPLTKHFVLLWNDHQIRLSATPLGVTDGDRGPVMSWRLHRLDIPSALQGQEDTVFTLIREAFATLGDVHDGEQYAAVNVQFDLSTR